MSWLAPSVAAGRPPARAASMKISLTRNCGCEAAAFSRFSTMAIWLSPIRTRPP